MGFWDKLEKFAEKTEEYGQKAQKWLDDNLGDNTKTTYSQSELLGYYVDNFGRLFYDTILSVAQKKDLKVTKLDFSSVEFGKKTIQNCKDGIYHIEIKCSNIKGYNEFGTNQGFFVLSLNIFANEYAEVDYSKNNTVEIKTHYEAQYGN